MTIAIPQMSEERLALARANRDFRRKRLRDGQNVTAERVLFCEAVDEIDRLTAELATERAENERLRAATKLTPQFVDGLLREQWLALRDDAGRDKLSEVRGYLLAVWQMGLVDDIGVEGWIARFKRCPGHEDEGGRVWCAFCGDMKPDPPDWPDDEATE